MEHYTRLAALRGARTDLEPCLKPSAEPAEPDDAVPGGNALLWGLGVVAVGFAWWQPRSPGAMLALVDWQTVGALAGLLAITQAVERSGVLQGTARRLLARVTHQRQLALWLTAFAALLAALVTNDVSLFLLVPLTRVLATQAELPLARLVVLQALAVNAGSALTPIGNPQNLFLWHRSGLGFGGFIAMMAPTVAVMLVWLFAAAWWLVPDKPIALQPDAPHGAVAPRLLALAGVLFVAFVVALDRHALLPGLALVFGALACLKPRVLLGIDWGLLAIIALMFVDLRQLAALPAVVAWAGALPIGSGLNAYLAAIVGSQFISNVPATIALDRYVHDLPALAAGVSVGGFGCVIGSLANLIALRLARLPKAARGLREFHRISIPFLLVCGASAALLRLH
ncbi:MAG: citrate transporter [Burkholderiales bacterium]|nr:citrate transporter [Burkholderiales bacterium]